MEEQKALKTKGGNMRLGAYDCTLSKDSFSYFAYDSETISERHRHRYEFNNDYREILLEKGIRFAGINPEKDLVEIIEMPNIHGLLRYNFTLSLSLNHTLLTHCLQTLLHPL